MMSSQFSYELDERQIRLTMQDAELEYNEALWNKFDSLATIESKSSFATIGNFIPSVNISISRSVIVPVLFVVLIGGLSAMLFSFVDFKKKETIDKETPLVANPNNFKKPEITTEKAIEPITKAEKPKIIADTTSRITIAPSETASQPSVTLIPEKKKEDTVKFAAIEKPKEVITPADNVKKDPAPRVEKRKKTRKVRPEILPIINASPNLNEGASEPELDLK